MRATLLALTSVLTIAYAHEAFATQTLKMPDGARMGEPIPDQRVLIRDSGNRPRAQSVWQAGEKSFYADLVANTRAEVLIVPIQVQMYGLSPASRSLMTAQFAKAIADATGLQLPDPYMVARALGDGDRSIAPDAVYQLAARLGVSAVVWGYVGHNEKGGMRFSISYWDRRGAVVPTGPNPPLTLHFPIIPISDQEPAFESFQAFLPQALAAFGLKSPDKSNLTTTADTRTATALPATPKALTVSTSDALRSARTFHAFAALAPWRAARVRERFAEKAYLALLRIPKTHPEYRVLVARTFMYLGERLSALVALDKPKTAEEKLLHSILNGNLPQARELVHEAPPGLARLAAELEVNTIAVAYGVRTMQESVERVKTLELPGEVWSVVTLRAANDREDWAQFDNAPFKGLLDLEFPIPNYTLENLIRGAAALGDVSKLDASVRVSVYEHRRRLLSQSPAQWCCTPAWGTPTSLDYLDLIESIGTDNLMRRARFLTDIQGRPQDAMDFIRQIEGVYNQHPQLEYATALAERALAESADEPAKMRLLQSSARHANNAMYWEQGQTPTAADAFRFDSGIQDRDKNRHGNYYASDLPYRPFYPDWDAGGQADTITKHSLAKLRQATYEFEPVTDMVWRFGDLQKSPERVAELLQSIDGRFAGHPRRALVFATHLRSQGDVAGAERHYKEGLLAQPGDWQTYRDYAGMLFEDGQTKRAARLMLRYPGFEADSKENRVRVSNHAFDAGSLFFWSGHLELAVPFFQIAASTNTGSAANITSASRLQLIERNYGSAVVHMQHRAQRYPSGYAFRDYLGMLYIRGHEKDAWAVFDALAPQLDTPHIWETVLVGHRLSGATEEQIYEWAKQDALRQAGDKIGYASMYLLRAGVTDRIPTDKLAARIADIEHPVWKVTDPDFTVRPDRIREHVLGPHTREDSTMRLGEFAKSEKARARSELVLFTDAYRALQSGDYESARKSLHEASLLYDLTIPQLGYMLPYYAFAGAKSGITAPVRAYLGTTARDRKRFDYYLATAVLAALERRHDDALRDLRLAIHRRPYTDDRPMLVEYQYAELCEWLYKETRDTRYRTIALAWAKSNQVIQPWFAWPYAVEAALSPNARERRRAIAIAHLLDKNSARLAKIKRSEIANALKEFENLNPFDDRDAGASERRI